MAVEIIDGTIGTKRIAVFYDNTTGFAFGPSFKFEQEARAFKDWLDDDPRSFSMDELATLRGEFRDEVMEGF